MLVAETVQPLLQDVYKRQASLITGIEPVLNPILVALVLGETLTRLSLLGGGIVFVSVMLYNVLSVRGAPQSPKNAGQTLPQKEEK